MSISESIATLISLISFAVGIAFIVFWLVVAWRAMRAHERIADALERAHPGDQTKGAIAPEAVKACVSCGKMIPKSYTKCLHCGQVQP